MGTPCHQKRKFLDAGSAAARARSYAETEREHGKPKRAELVNAYRCTTCGFWHVGHSARSKWAARAVVARVRP